MTDYLQKNFTEVSRMSRANTANRGLLQLDNADCARIAHNLQKNFAEASTLIPPQRRQQQGAHKATFR